MSDSSNTRHSRKVPVFDPQETVERRQHRPTSQRPDETTTNLSRPHSFINDDETVQIKIRTLTPPPPPPGPLMDDGSTTILNRQQLFAEAVRLDQIARRAKHAAPSLLEQTLENPQIADYLPPDIRPTIATPAITEKTIADQEVVTIGSWREFIVEVDEQMCLIVPIEIARSGLLRPGRRLVARIRTLDE